MQERHRIARNQAIPGYKREVQEWRKIRKLWEWNLVGKLWGEKEIAVFPRNASRELIDDCAPTKITTEGPEYITDSEVELSDEVKDNIVIIGSSSEESEVSKTQEAGSGSTLWYGGCAIREKGEENLMRRTMLSRMTGCRTARWANRD